MKIIQLPKKEMLAWILLICAALLFSFSIAFAQDKKADSESTVRIKIEKNEDGKKIKLTRRHKRSVAEVKMFLKDEGN